VANQPLTIAQEATDPGRGRGWPARRLPFIGRLTRDPLLRRMLAVADAGAALVASVYLGSAAGGNVTSGIWPALFLPIWILLAKIHGLYDRDHRALRHLSVDEVPTILLWAAIGTLATELFMRLATPLKPLGIIPLATTTLLVAVAAFTFRSLARILWRRVTPREATLLVGEGPLAHTTRRKLELFPDIHAKVVRQKPAAALGNAGAYPEQLAGIDRVIVASPMIDEALISALLTYCRRRHIKISVVPPVRGVFGTAVHLNHIADLPVVEYNTWDVSRSTLLLKRTLDVTVSFLALVVGSPLFLLIALAIKLDSAGPVIFAQVRAGTAGRPFRMFKFRTMVENAEELLGDLVAFDDLHEPVFKLPNDPRVTRVGRFLRKTSLDELPQLVNVLRGTMSLVGPRPEQVELVERYRPEARFRLTVKPGLTGPMQIYGRGELAFEERLAVEREYIENLSIGRDLRILALTIAPVLSGRGAF
jgi:exopolysaccharide biosynthesis polyprenyl glycosylphosphotransferase